jgi:peptidyl-prolyl cis-trans isomerase SDCCAG10
VACASDGQSDSSNGSQFFITTERADELTRKYTIFGRVSGETIFTVLRMQEVEVDDTDRPVDPPVITSCEVLLPPFDDIVPRTTPAEKKAKAAAAAEAKKLADIKKRKQQGMFQVIHIHWLHIVCNIQ